MANEVSQSELTLLKAIEQGVVEKPKLMKWNAFQVWRKKSRPSVDVDKISTTTLQEAALWKLVMLELYGESWALDLAAAEEEIPTTQSSEPIQVPAADAGAEAAAEAAAPVTPRKSMQGPQPGSTPVAEPGGGSPGGLSGLRSPGSGLGTPLGGVLVKKVTSPGRGLKRYQPGAESLEDYIAKVTQQASVMEAIGSPLTGGELDALLCMAGYEQRLFDDAPNHQDEQVKILKRELASELFEVDGSTDQLVRLAVLAELLQIRGSDAGLVRDRIKQHDDEREKETRTQQKTARQVDFNTREETPPPYRPPGGGLAGVLTPTARPHMFQVHTGGSQTPLSHATDPE